MAKEYEWDAIKMAAEITKAAVSAGTAGSFAMSEPKRAAELLKALTEQIDALFHGRS